jgi:hypothetical protein
MRLGCLHTAESNVAIFKAARDDLDVELVHHVRPDLMEAAEREGGLTGEIAAETVWALRELGREVDAVILTCSTLGPIVDLAPEGGVPWLRADAALADIAVTQGRNIVVLCAVETTVEPTTTLFGAAAARMETPPQIDVWLVPGAWEAFKDGNIAEYYLRLTDAANAAYDGGADVVAFAQASMAGAALDASHGIPLTSPRAALERAMEAVARRQS